MVCEAIPCNSNCMELSEKGAGQSLLFFEYCSPLCLKADKVLHDAVHQMRVKLHGSHLIPQQGRLNRVKAVGEFKGHSSDSAP